EVGEAGMPRLDFVSRSNPHEDVKGGDTRGRVFDGHYVQSVVQTLLLNGIRQNAPVTFGGIGRRYHRTGQHYEGNQLQIFHIKG
ncbi:MAG: hypothetical protein ACKOA1_05025, partial [Bacteroidota bacterium]